VVIAFAKFSADNFLFLQKQQTLVSLNKRFGRNSFKMQTAPACKPLWASLIKKTVCGSQRADHPM
jgi:hypothetical protein